MGHIRHVDDGDVPTCIYAVGPGGQWEESKSIPPSHLERLLEGCALGE